MGAPLLIKVPLGETLAWEHWLPGLVDIEDADDFEFTVTRAGVPVAVTVVAASERELSIPANGVAADLRTVTITPGDDPAVPPETALVGYPYGRAVIISGSLGVIPVIIAERVNTTQVILADPLPRGWKSEDPAKMRYTGIRSLWTDGDVTASLGNLTLRLRYTWSVGGSSRTETLTGVVKVVRQPFATGLNHHSLMVSGMWLGNQVPPRQQSWEPQIQSAQATLEQWIRAALVGGTRDEDGVNGAAFHEVHAALTIGNILASHTAQGANRAEARDFYRRVAREEFDSVMQSQPWVDDDGDGVVDDGEAAVSLRARPEVDGRFTALRLRRDGVAYEPPFKRGDRH